MQKPSVPIGFALPETRVYIVYRTTKPPTKIGALAKKKDLNVAEPRNNGIGSAYTSGL